MEGNNHDPKKEMLSTPAAIIVGSVLISLSVLFSGGVGTHTANTATAGNTTGTPATLAEHLIDTATQLGLSKKDFSACLASNQFDQKITDSENEGATAGVNGTPTSFIIGRDGTQFVISGAQPYAAVKAAIDQALAGTLPKNTSPANLRPVDATDKVAGNPSAAVTFVEYSDLQCPFCIQFHPTVKQILTEYGDKVRFVYRHFPLSFHPNARPFAEAVECANKLGGTEKFYDMVDAIFTNGPSWN